MDDTTEHTDESIVEMLMAPENTEAGIEQDEPEAEADGEADTLEEEGQDEATADQAEPEYFTVKVDGEDVRVTRDELVRAYSGEAAIQKRFREVAEVRKAAETEVATLQEQRAALLSFAQEIQTKGVLSAPTPPDAAMLEKDPMGYMRADAKFRQEMAEYMTQRQQIETLTAQQRQQEERRLDAMRHDEMARLVEHIPDLAQPEKAPKVRDMLLRAGTDYGYSADEIGGVLDHRALRVLHDAARYRELQAGKARLEPKLAKAGPVLKPGAVQRTDPASDARKMREKLKRSGSVDDAIALMLKG